MIYLPDTNVFSRYFRGQDLGLKVRLETHLASSRLSAIVVSELEYGAAKRPDFPAYAERVHRLRTILVEVLDYTGEDAKFYGSIGAHLANRKPNALPIGPYDLMLAAQALRIGATVVTHPLAEFSRVPGLTVVDGKSAP